MRVLIRAAGALAAKEVGHHWIPFLVMGVWSCLMIPITVAMSLDMGSVSFTSGAASLAYYYGPLVVFIVVRRLVVIEYVDKTNQFLEALPAPAWLRLAVKSVVGWCAIVLISSVYIVPLMSIAAYREFVTLTWFGHVW